MASHSSQLPLTASHLRLHQSLDLHLFDRDNRLVAAIPLRDQMVMVYYLVDEDSNPLYKVTEDAQDSNQSYQVRIPLKVPVNGSEYFDGIASQPGVEHGQWFFTLGFQKNPDDPRIGDLEGIGIVDIADISIGPKPIQRVQPTNWLRRLLNCLFPPQPGPTDTGEFVGMPSHFPSVESILVRLKLHFKLPSDGGNNGPVPIRIGGFIGHEANATMDIPYLAICAHPSWVTLQSELLNTGN